MVLYTTADCWYSWIKTPAEDIFYCLQTRCFALGLCLLVYVYSFRMFSCALCCFIIINRLSRGSWRCCYIFSFKIVYIYFILKNNVPVYLWIFTWDKYYTLWCSHIVISIDGNKSITDLNIYFFHINIDPSNFILFFRCK